MTRTPRRRLLCSLLLSLVFAAVAFPVTAVEYRKRQEKPGATVGLTPQSVTAASAARNLEAFYSESGPLVLSVDGIGTVLSFGTVEVEKPADAVAKRAFLIAATGGNNAGEIRDGEISIEGRRVMWDRSIPNVIGGWNALAEGELAKEGRGVIDPRAFLAGEAEAQALVRPDGHKGRIEAVAQQRGQ